jgi:beta-galactosidase
VAHGKAVVIVRSTRQPGTIRVNVTSQGLKPGMTTIQSLPAATRATSVPGIRTAAAGASAGAASAAAASQGQPASPAADASYSGAPDTTPSAMLDGKPDTHWSNYYDKPATANIKAVSVSGSGDWVSLAWQRPQRFGQLNVSFVTGGPLSLPASIVVTYWNGRDLAPVRNLHIEWAQASGQPTTLTFEPVTTSQIRLTMTSRSPGTSAGFLAIAELQAVTS